MSSILSLTVLVAVLMINTISVVLPALSRTFTSAPAWRRIEAAAAFPLMADTRMRGVQRDTLSITSTCQSTKTHALNWQYRVKLTIWQSNGPQTVHLKKKKICEIVKQKFGCLRYLIIWNTFKGIVHPKMKTCLKFVFVINKSIIKMFLTSNCFQLKYESSIHTIVFSREKVIWSKSGEKCAQIKHCLQAKAVINKHFGGFWYERTTG